MCHLPRGLHSSAGYTTLLAAGPAGGARQAAGDGSMRRLDGPIIESENRAERTPPPILPAGASSCRWSAIEVDERSLVVVLPERLVVRSDAVTLAFPLLEVALVSTEVEV